jgi:predicted phage terminase large subunit-like protein
MSSSNLSSALYVSPQNAVNPLILASQNESLRRACLSDFYTFVRHAWEHVDPTPFKDGFHIRVLCHYLTLFSDPEHRYFKNLLINIPPGHAKSLISSVLFPAWLWLRDPASSFLCASHNQELSTRDSVKCRDLIRTEWYQKLFLIPSQWVMNDDQDAKTYYKNTRHGFRFSMGVGSGVVGWRARYLLVDDPMDSVEFPSEDRLNSVISWFNYKMPSRLNDFTRGKLVIMQRLHANDLSGHILKKHARSFEHLCMQAQYDPSSLPPNSNRFFNDPRQPGELLFPEVYGWPQIEDLSNSLGSYGTAGQLQQSPIPHSGGFIQHNWLRRYSPSSGFPLDEVSTLIQSWDCAVEGGSKNDFVVGQLWGKFHATHPRYPNAYVLIDQIRERADFPKNLRMISAFSEKHPRAVKKLIEKKANGAPIIQTLKQTFNETSIIPFDPQSRSKEARVSAIAPLFERGLVFIPHDDAFPWVSTYVEELTTFNRGDHDDQVDATAQALLHLSGAKRWSFIL